MRPCFGPQLATEDLLMENRWSIRKPHSGEVTVEGPGLGRICAILRDVSLGGALVDTGEVNLPLNTPLSVAFNLFPGDHNSDFRLHATVVRRDAMRAGLL